MSTLFTPQSTKYLPGSLTSLESSQVNTIMLGSRRSSSAMMQRQSGMYAAPSRHLHRIKAQPKTASEPTPHPSCQQSRSWTSHSLLQSAKLIRRNVLQTVVKTHANPQDVKTSDQPQEQTDRQRLHAQMAEVIRRAGSGLERGVRWKSGTAPGTRSLAEVSTLTGNSVNAEVVAKERVNTVHCLHLPDEELAILH